MSACLARGNPTARALRSGYQSPTEGCGDVPQDVSACAKLIVGRGGSISKKDVVQVELSNVQVAHGKGHDKRRESRSAGVETANRFRAPVAAGETRLQAMQTAMPLPTPSRGGLKQTAPPKSLEPNGSGFGGIEHRTPQTRDRTR